MLQGNPMEEKYRVIFKGEIAPAADPLEVRKNLAALYRVDIKEIERFFSGKRFVLKENIDLEAARKYTAQFEAKTGARCAVIKMESPVKDTPPPQKDAAADSEASPPAREKTSTGYETRYRLMFKGELIIDKDINEVKTNLSILYKVKPERIEGFFTGKPVTIVEPTDFWTVTAYLNRFKECGAVGYLEAVEPAGSVKYSETSQGSQHDPAQQKQAPIPSAEPEAKPAPGPAPEEPESGEREIKLLAGSLYDLLTSTYSQVKLEYKIEKKHKELQKNETTLGCLILTIILAAIAMVIFTPMRWYWALVGTIVMIIILSLFSKPWDTRHAEAFLKRLEGEKQKDYPLFAATLKKWVNDLPADDRSRVFFLEAVNKILAEIPAQETTYEKYSRIISPVESAIQEEEVWGKKAEKKSGREIVLCPRCGSNWVSTGQKGFSWGKGVATTLFLGPLAGAVAGSMGEGKEVYVCERCGKKWPRR
jgi:hypothetical protein